MPGYPRVLAKDLVVELRKQAIEQFEVPVHLETTALRIEYEPDPDDAERQIVRLVTDKGDLLSRTIVIAGGHGAFEPKKLPGMPLDEWEGKGLHYLVGEKSAFEGKDVVIVGGGDSACDWTVNLLGTARSIALVHRREQFRAHEVTVGEIMEANEAGRVQVLTPYQLRDRRGRRSRSRRSPSSTRRTRTASRRSPVTRCCSSSASRRRSARSRTGASRSRRARSRSTTS